MLIFSIMKNLTEDAGILLLSLSAMMIKEPTEDVTFCIGEVAQLTFTNMY